MEWTGIAVELGGKRQSHAAAIPQVVDLLGRESLDRTLLQTCIGLVGLRGSGAAHDHQCGRREKGLHLMLREFEYGLKPKGTLLCLAQRGESWRPPCAGFAGASNGPRL